MHHIAPLFDGPLDIVGDVHGEIHALESLLATLGYVDGVHPEGRRLVFLGDLVDRGPDSPAVIERVRDLVTRDLAQCLLGNHELNLLRKASKEGNRWYVDPDHPENREAFHASTVARDEGKKRGWAEFFGTLPLALERADLRLVHAAWHAPSIAILRATPAPTMDVFNDYAARSQAELEQSGLAVAAKRERDAHADAIFDASRPVPLLRNLGLRDEHFQMSNPLRIVTSGVERTTDTPFWAGGKWRMCDRVRWWNEYHDDIPVIIGHYWRIAGNRTGPSVSDGKPDMFDGARYNEWQGARGNVFCVDFSIGGRYRERARDVEHFTTHLAAVRWPEREVVFEDGLRSPLVRG